MHDRVEYGKDSLSLTVLGVSIPLQLIIVLGLLLCTWKRQKRLIRQALAKSEDQQTLLASPVDSDKTSSRRESFEMRDDIVWDREYRFSDEAAASSSAFRDPGPSGAR